MYSKKYTLDKVEEFGRHNYLYGMSDEKNRFGLVPCASCGCKMMWIITHRSFLKQSVYVECSECGYKTKRFWRRKKAIKTWNERVRTNE